LPRARGHGGATRGGLGLPEARAPRAERPPMAAPARRAAVQG